MRAADSISCSMLVVRIVGVCEQGEQAGLGNKLGKQVELLGHQLPRHDADAREVATRPAETANEPISDRVACREDNWDRRGCAFRCHCRRCTAREDHVYLATNEVGGQSRQPVIIVLRPAVFDRHILSLDVAGFAQSLVERGY
jgi:hypothetical protein